VASTGHQPAGLAVGSCHKDVKMFDILTNAADRRSSLTRSAARQTRRSSVARNCAASAAAAAAAAV